MGYGPATNDIIARPIRYALRLVRIGSPLFVAAAALDGSFAVFLIAMQAFLPDMMQGGSGSPGYALGLYGVSRVLLQAPGGLLARRVGERRLIGVGMALGVIGLLVLSQAHSLTIAYLLVFLYGGGTALAWPAIYLRVSDLVQQGRGELFGMLTLGALSATMVGLTTAALVVDRINERALVFGAGLTLAAGTVTFGILSMRTRYSTGERSAPLHDPVKRPRRSVARLFVTLILQGIGLSMLLPILRQYAHDQLHLQMNELIVFALPAGFFGALVFFVSGRVTDRLGRTIVVACGSTVAALGVTLIAMAGDITLFALGAIVLAVGFAMNSPAIGAWITDFADRAGGHVGLALTVQGISFAAGPAVAGGVAKSAGAPAAMQVASIFWLLAGLSAIVPVKWMATRPRAASPGTSPNKGVPSLEPESDPLIHTDSRPDPNQ